MTDPGGQDRFVLDDWITPREASELIGISPNQVRTLARKGRIQARKFGVAWITNRESALERAGSHAGQPGS